MLRSLRANFALSISLSAMLYGCVVPASIETDITFSDSATQLPVNLQIETQNENKTMPTDLMEHIRKFFKDKNHEALFQSKVVREDLVPSTANQLSLGYHFRTGQSFGTYQVKPSLEKALRWYERATTSGSGLAHFNVACLTYKSRQAFKDIPEPYRSAKAAAEMEVAAEQGLLFAQLDLSSYYRHGIGVDVNFEWADYWLNKAYNTLSKGYLSGIRPPKPKDPLALQGPPPFGKWEYLYFDPEDAAEWLALHDTLADEPLSKSEQSLIIQSYLEVGYCSPVDVRDAMFLKLQ